MRYSLAFLFAFGMMAQSPCPSPDQHMVVIKGAMVCSAGDDLPDPPKSITLKHRLQPGGATIKLFVEEHGKCAMTAKEGSDYTKAHHETEGRVYGFWIHRKIFTSPVTAQRFIYWLCRYHIADMTGTDPETGEKPKWVVK